MDHGFGIRNSYYYVHEAVSNLESRDCQARCTMGIAHERLMLGAASVGCTTCNMRPF